MSATGGSVTQVGSNRIHTFTTTGSSTFTTTSALFNVQILVVGGGGGGGYDRAAEIGRAHV